MNMKTISITKILGIIGILSCAATFLLRERIVVDSKSLQLILWVTPNIGATFAIASFVETSYPAWFKKEYTFKVAVITIILIFICAIISEVIHDLYLNSPIDINDIIASIIASVIYLVGSFITTIKKPT